MNGVTETTLWAVTTGEYSDYRVQALFTTKKDAEAAAAATADGWNQAGDVEEFILYDGVPERVTAYRLTTEIRDDGTFTESDLRVESGMPWTLLWGYPPARPTVRFVRAPIHQDKGGRLEVYGRSEKAVRKVTSERRAALLVAADQTGKAGPEVNR